MAFRSPAQPSLYLNFNVPNNELSHHCLRQLIS
jgi:hypothetical protein